MAYALKYYFPFVSTNGTEYRIELLQDGYTGSSYRRRLGQTPVLKREQSGQVWGSSLELYAECEVDQEYADLYTTDAHEWFVKLYRVGTADVLLWTGFVDPELYSEPDIAPPYDVQIIATDGLGNLKYIDFDSDNVTDETELPHSSGLPGGDFGSTLNYMAALMSNDTQGWDVDTLPKVFSSMYCYDGQTTFNVPTFGQDFDMSRYDGETCYDVLQSMLTQINAVMFRELVTLRWVILRETDLQLSTYGGMFWATPKWWDGSTGTTTSFEKLGSINTCTWWPVGQLTTKVEPAKRRVTVTHAYEWKDAINGDPDMDNGFGTTTGTWRLGVRAVVHTINTGTSSADNGFLIGDPTNGYGRIYQTLTVTSNTSKKMQLDLKMCKFANNNYGAELNICNSVLSGGAYTYYYLTKYTDADGNIYYNWSTSNTNIVLAPEYASGTTTLLSDISLVFEGLKQGTLNITIRSVQTQEVFVGGCWLHVYEDNQCTGARAIVSINNDAREEDEEIELQSITGDGDILMLRSDMIDERAGVGGLQRWGSHRFYASRNLEFLALDRAVQVALPRLRSTGTVNVPKDTVPPLLGFTHRSNAYILETFEWELWTDEMTISAVTVPSASIDVTSMTVTTKEI